MSKEERKIVSYHEVGHALISALQKNSEPVQKITIVPRTMGALGYVMHVPEDEKYLNSKAELHDMIVGLLGGRAAEEIMFDTVTTGAANDIERATNIARSMVTRYGMSEKFGLMGLATVESQYLDSTSTLNCAENTAAEIDAEVMKILKEAYDEALDLLRDNKDVMDKIAAYLIEKETITGKEFMKIYREEKGLPEPEEKKAEDTEEKPSQEKAAQEESSVASDMEDAKGQTEDLQEQESEPKVPSPQELRDFAPQQPVFQIPGYTQNEQNAQNEQNTHSAQNEQNRFPQGQQENEEQGDEQQNVKNQTNGEGGEKSRFGSAWDRNVNG